MRLLQEQDRQKLDAMIVDNWSGSSKAMEPDMSKKHNPQSMLLTIIAHISILEIKVAFLLRNLVIIKCAMY